MTVKDLIKDLQRCDPDKTIMVDTIHNPGYNKRWNLSISQHINGVFLELKSTDEAKDE